MSAVTLELSLEDSEKLDLARSVGTLSLVLRNQVDKEKVVTAGITMSQLFGEKALVAVSVAAPSPARPRPIGPRPVVLPAAECVEVIQHASRTLNCF